MIVPVVVGWPADVGVQKAPELERFAKLLKKHEAPEAGQASGSDGKLE
jgi:hypothetical protein